MVKNRAHSRLIIEGATKDSSKISKIYLTEQCLFICCALKKDYI